MDFSVEQPKAVKLSRPIGLLLVDNEYRHSQSSLINGDVSWRCLGRIFKSNNYNDLM